MAVPSVLFGRRQDPEAHTIERYLATDGYGALRRAVHELTPEQVLDEVQASGLTGRSGGSAFTTTLARSLRAGPIDRIGRLAGVHSLASDSARSRSLVAASPDSTRPR